MQDKQSLPESDASEVLPRVERVAVVGGPLDGNVYAAEFKPGAHLKLKSLGAVNVYQFSDIDERGPVLHFVGPAPPVL